MSTQISKQLAYILRHHPESVGLTLTPEGWVSLVELSQATRIPVQEILSVAAADSKQRFTVLFGAIRAAQGHTHPSVTVTFSAPKEVPEFLWHGTTQKAWETIQVEGLKPMQRQKVHLSSSPETAVQVGARRQGPHVLLKISTASLEGLEISENGVWMINHVPASAIQSV